ncbi:MAG: WGR domain-containing protein, partial [Cyanobacteria bacterium P01_A01_bin.83]
MTLRQFEYQDDKSSKFWNITIENCSHTVTYGKTGTKGRTQSKSFDTETEAKKSYEKLIQQKLKKGYVEVATNNNVKEEKIKDKSTKSKKTVGSKAKTTSVGQAVTIPEKLEITRAIDLNPEDWHWATWRPRTPLPEPEVKPFDLKKAKNYLNEIIEVRFKSICFKNRDKGDINLESHYFSEEEAWFWLIVITHKKYNLSKLEFIDSVCSRLIDIEVTIDNIIILLIGTNGALPPIIAPIINCLLPFTDFIVALNQMQSIDNKQALELAESNYQESDLILMRGNGALPKERKLREKGFGNLIRNIIPNILITVIEGFEKYIWHYLEDSEIEMMRNKLSSSLALKPIIHQEALHYLAAYLGMHERVSDIVEDIPNVYPQLYRLHRYKLLCGLGSANLVESKIRQWQLSELSYILLNNNSTYIRLCLANTEYYALDLIRNSILKAGRKDGASKLIETFALVKAPEAAPYMLESWLSSKAPSIARQWLDDNPIHSIVGLIPVAAGELPTPPVKVKPNELSRAAIDYLISLKRKGYEDLIRQAIEQQPAEIAAVINEKVLDIEEDNSEPFDEET